MILLSIRLLFCLVCGFSSLAAVELLNVSYDPTREFYNAYDHLFVKYWRQRTNQEVSIRQSHGGSGKQTRAVLEGLKADVVTLALAYDIDQLAKQGLLPLNWATRLPNHSSPYQSTVVFLVRKDNPKQIRDWDDLTRPGISVIMANPKTSGGARWNFLAAYGYALRKNHQNEAAAQEFIKKLYGNVPVLDSGARAATTTFVFRRLGDVLVTWENEAFLALNELGSGSLEMVYPSMSILAEPPVAVVDRVVDQKGTREVAEAYLSYLYSPAGQDLIARHFYRPVDPAVAKKYAERFVPMQLFTIEDFGGWEKAQAKYFNDGGLFDQIYQAE